MKTRILIIVCLSILPILAFSTTDDQKPQKFEVTFTVTFNSMTLEDAFIQETRFRKLFKGACAIKTNLKSTTSPDNVGYWIIEDDEMDSLQWRGILQMEPLDSGIMVDTLIFR